jgi:hypothetical protein
MTFCVMWDKTCDECDAPLNLTFFSYHEENILRIMGLFAYSLNTSSNRICYKPTHKRIYCKYCLDVLDCNIFKIINRECGIKYNLHSNFPKPITKHELYKWCERTDTILKNDPIDLRQLHKTLKQNINIPDNVLFLTENYYYTLIT